MLEKLLKLYVMAMAGDVRSPVPHLFGPPGCGKSQSVEQAAELLGVNLHVLNVSRINPLELEGYQLPNADNTHLQLLTATTWQRLKEGDIVFLDEFLRGFPEVYNGLLDIMTSREVAGFKLPKVFFIAASNSVTAYDKALEDRLLHLPVKDPRESKPEYTKLSKILCNSIGLMPSMADSYEMRNLMDNEVLPTFELMDLLKNRANIGVQQISGCSVRNLIGQAQLREIQSKHLKELIQMNNTRALQEGLPQYIVLLDTGAGSGIRAYPAEAAKLQRARARLTALQQHNLDMNLQLLALQEARLSPTEKEDEDVDIFTE